MSGIAFVMKLLPQQIGMSKRKHNASPLTLYTGRLYQSLRAEISQRVQTLQTSLSNHLYYSIQSAGFLTTAIEKI